MHRYLVKRTFPGGLAVPADEAGAESVPPSAAPRPTPLFSVVRM